MRRHPYGTRKARVCVSSCKALHSRDLRPLIEFNANFSRSFSLLSSTNFALTAPDTYSYMHMCSRSFKTRSDWDTVEESRALRKFIVVASLLWTLKIYHPLLDKAVVGWALTGHKTCNFFFDVIYAMKWHLWSKQNHIWIKHPSNPLHYNIKKFMYKQYIFKKECFCDGVLKSISGIW